MIWLIFIFSIDFRYMEAALRKGFGDLADMFRIVRFDGDLELHFFEAVRDLGLIVIELDDVGILFGQNLGDLQELAWLVRQLNGKAEYAAARDERFIDER